jgi:predicted  nucleic acid-binding Zn-ribbon protein
MLKYLVNITKRLEEIKSGIEKNSPAWKHIPENISMIDSHISELNNKNKEIESLKNSISFKYKEARQLSTEKKILISRLEKRAIGVHADNPGKLNEYGIKNNYKINERN